MGPGVQISPSPPLLKTKFSKVARSRPLHQICKTNLVREADPPYRNRNLIHFRMCCKYLWLTPESTYESPPLRVACCLRNERHLRYAMQLHKGALPLSDATFVRFSKEVILTSLVTPRSVSLESLDV